MKNIFYFAMVAVTAIFAGCANDEDALLPNDSLKDTPINVDVLVSGINTRAGYDNTSLPKTSTSYVLNVQTDQSNADGIKASDHLYYHNDAFTPSENGTVSIPFNHIMSKISVKLTLGTEYESSATNPITSVSAFGASTGATYSPGAGTPWSAESNVSKITLIPSVAYDKNNHTVTYEAILVPQKIAANAFGIEIRIGEKTYEWKSAAAFTLTGGTNNTLEMTVGKPVGNASSANII